MERSEENADESPAELHDEEGEDRPVIKRDP